MPATPNGFLSGIPNRDQRRQRLADAIAALLRAMDAGHVDPTHHELDIVAQLCEDHDLPVEATRVRRQIRSTGS